MCLLYILKKYYNKLKNITQLENNKFILYNAYFYLYYVRNIIKIKLTKLRPYIFAYGPETHSLQKIFKSFAFQANFNITLVHI